MLDINKKIRVYLDSIEEWKVYTVKEVISKVNNTITRYQLEDNEGNTLVRALNDESSSNTIKEFRYLKCFTESELEKASGEKRYLWDVHYVFCEDDEDVEAISCHTHGMSNIIGYELEITIPLDPEQAMLCMNAICVGLALGDYDIYDGKEMSSSDGALVCPQQYYKTETVLNFVDDKPDKDKEILYRIVLPDLVDGEFIFPTDETEEAEDLSMMYKNQLLGIK